MVNEHHFTVNRSSRGDELEIKIQRNHTFPCRKWSVLPKIFFYWHGLLDITHCGLVICHDILVNISSGYGLLLDGTKPLPKIMWTIGKVLWHAFQGNVYVNGQNINPFLFDCFNMVCVCATKHWKSSSAFMEIPEWTSAILGKKSQHHNGIDCGPTLAIVILRSPKPLCHSVFVKDAVLSHSFHLSSAQPNSIVYITIIQADRSPNLTCRTLKIHQDISRQMRRHTRVLCCVCAHQNSWGSSHLFFSHSSDSSQISASILNTMFMKIIGHIRHNISDG